MAGLCGRCVNDILSDIYVFYYSGRKRKAMYSVRKAEEEKVLPFYLLITSK